jgi:hypothetical protein
VRSKPEDRKVSGLWHFRLGAVKQRAIQSGSRNWGCGVEVVELVVRLISMGRGSKSIRRWRKDRKRKKAEREKRKLAAADQRRDSSRQRSR